MARTETRPRLQNASANVTRALLPKPSRSSAEHGATANIQRSSSVKGRCSTSRAAAIMSSHARAK